MLGESAWVLVLVLFGIIYCKFRNVNDNTSDISDIQKSIVNHLVIRENIKNYLMREIDTTYVKIDPNTGNVELKENIFFKLGSAILTNQGKKVLSNVWPKYSRILLDTSVTKGELDKIAIIGYASKDHRGVNRYLDDLMITEKRAYYVCDYILQDISLSASKYSDIKKYLLAAGRSHADAYAIYKNIPDSIKSNIKREQWLNEHRTFDRKVVISYQLKSEELLNDVSLKLGSLIYQRNEITSIFNK